MAISTPSWAPEWSMAATPSGEFGCIAFQPCPGFSGWPRGSPATWWEGSSSTRACRSRIPPLSLLADIQRRSTTLSPGLLPLPAPLPGLTRLHLHRLCPAEKFPGPRGWTVFLAQQPLCLALEASSPQDMGSKDLAAILGKGRERESSHSRANKSGKLVSVNSPAIHTGYHG